jgi:hypothetical protein
MELLTILLSSLLSLISPVGILIDRVAETAIRDQLQQAQELQVRVDNAPSHQLLQGRVERVRIAGRNLRLKQQDIQIALLELETDPIEVNPRSFRQRRLKLNRPLQAGVRLVLTQENINKALQSPELIARLRKINLGLPGNVQSSDFVNPRVEFLTNNRLRFQVEIREQGKEQPLFVLLETGLDVASGRQIQLIEPIIFLNGEEVPKPFVKIFISNIGQRLDLKNLEPYGLQARILQLKMRKKEIELAAFLRVEPSSKLWENRR